MKTWTFTNGWQTTRLRRVSVILIMNMLLTTGFADDKQRDNVVADIPPLDLLEMLGQFEQQDDAWVDNELNTETGKDSSKQQEKQVVDDDE